jgi:tetratricopeptide (TPR) repeat protein
LTENYLISFFRTFDELATLVSIAVSNFDHKKLSSKNLSMQQKLDSLEKKLLEKVPEEIYPLKQLAPTELDEVGTIARSIEELFDEGAVISNAETYYRLGNYQFTIANYERAISLYRQAIQIHPVGQKPYLALGLAYEELGNWSEAMDAYRSADRLNPSPMDLASVLHNLAATYAAREDFQKAALSYERAIALAEQYHHPTPYLYKGAAALYERLNDRVQEHRSLKKFIELSEQLGITNKSEMQVAKRRVEFLENRKE